MLLIVCSESFRESGLDVPSDDHLSLADGKALND
jgi:hypothetical protein